MFVPIGYAILLGNIKAVTDNKDSLSSALLGFLGEECEIVHLVTGGRLSGLSSLLSALGAKKREHRRDQEFL